MPVDIQPPSKQLLKEVSSLFTLQQDDWDDYSFKTLYHLYHRHGNSPADFTYIGGVKIMYRGQRPGDGTRLTKPFDQLGDDFVSVGTSLDYYGRLNEIPELHRRRIVRYLNDAVAKPSLVEQFSKEKAWEKSLFRDNAGWRQFLSDAGIMMRGAFSELVNVDGSFSFQPVGAKRPISFAFGGPDTSEYLGRYRRVGPSRKRTLLPDRIVVLIGPNGSGKSTVLSKIAHIAFASPAERQTPKVRKSVGELTPPSIGFMRVITISYSAFDSFVVPGRQARDLEQASRDLESGEGRFVFCGLRDLAAEAREDVIAAEGADDQDMVERRTSTRLKPIEALADEFVELLNRIRRDDRTELLLSALEPLVGDSSFYELKEQLQSLTEVPRAARKLFMSWSTGHKIALHVTASLVAHLRPRSLVLFDEPEAHLHPPLVAALMRSVRIVLTEVNAFCIVATHSPVLLQETLARHVRYIAREGGELSVTTPKAETFGENIGLLTYDAFGLKSSRTDYYNVLDLLADGHSNAEEIDQYFTGGLSGQARAYVLSRLAVNSSK